MTDRPDRNDHEKSLARASLKFAGFLILVIAIFYAAQNVTYTFMSTMAGS